LSRKSCISETHLTDVSARNVIMAQSAPDAIDLLARLFGIDYRMPNLDNFAGAVPLIG
jgi:hypothetical protein